MKKKKDNLYDFDTPYNRIGTQSFKWDGPIGYFGVDIEIAMGVADMDFKAPPCITEALAERCKHENWGYLYDLAFYIDAIVKWNRKRYGIELEPNSIVSAIGVNSSIIAALRTFSPKGSKVLLITPVYNGFYHDLYKSHTLANNSPMIFRDGRYEIDWDDLESRITPDTHAMLLCNPHNPTGNVWSEEELLRIGELCLAHQIVVLSDEIFCDLVRKGQKFTSFATLPNQKVVNNSVIFRSLSKTFNIPAMKTGYFFSTNNTFLEHIKVNNIGEPNTLGIFATEAACRLGGEWLDQLLPYLDENHSFVQQYIEQHLPLIGYTKAQGTFFSWLDFSPVIEAIGAKEKSAKSKQSETPLTPEQVLAAWIAENAKVHLNPGSLYRIGGENHMRMNVATSRQLIERALDNIANALKKI